MKRSTMLVFCAVLVLPAAAFAQFEACPGGVQVGQQCGGGVCQPVCQYDRAATQAPQAPRTVVRRGVWEDRWGAVADDKGGKIGVSTGHRSRNEARRAATADCLARGGAVDGCRFIAVSYRNGCVAYSWAEGESFLSTDRSLEGAERRALDRCKEKQGGNCELIYSDCSEAVFLGYE